MVENKEDSKKTTSNYLIYLKDILEKMSECINEFNCNHIDIKDLEKLKFDSKVIAMAIDDMITNIKDIQDTINKSIEYHQKIEIRNDKIKNIIDENKGRCL